MSVQPDDAWYQPRRLPNGHVVYKWINPRGKAAKLLATFLVTGEYGDETERTAEMLRRQPHLARAIDRAQARHDRAQPAGQRRTRQRESYAHRRR